jgi:heme o synthase
MLPVVAGGTETKRQIFIYSLVPISVLPWALGFAGAIYGATAGILGAAIILLALQLRRSSEADKRLCPSRKSIRA